MNEEKRQHYEAILTDVAKQSSERERKADEAERETIKLKKVEYMSQHLWEVYEGVISGVTAWASTWNCRIPSKVWYVLPLYRGLF